MTQIEIFKQKFGKMINNIPASVDSGAGYVIDEVYKILDSLEDKLPEGLEEAAEISFDEADALTKDYMNFLAKGLTENKPRPIGPHWFSEYAKKRFIAGAEWQVSQMPMPEDTVLFQKGVAEGRRLEREDMLNDAMEAKTFYLPFGKWRVTALVGKDKIEEGDKVRIVVLKEKEE